MPQTSGVLQNAFIGRTEVPTDGDLEAVLGRSAKAFWDQLLAVLAEQHQFDTQEWNSYSTKAGWSLRLKRNKRAILYLSPRHGGFQASLVLGDKAIKAARAARLPARVIETIDSAKRYAEGTGVRLDVKGPADIAVVQKLAAIKVAN